MENILNFQARKTAWWLILLQGIAAIIIGILLLISPARTIAILVQLLGLYWLISGVFSLVSIILNTSSWGWKLAAGILGIIAGIIVIQYPLWTAFLIPATLLLYLAILGVINGIVQIVQGIRDGDGGAIGFGILSIAFGIILFFASPVLALTLPIVLGIVGIIGGVALIIMSFRVRRSQHRAAYEQPAYTHPIDR
jgi:uncharacterized membrane protein HdeD (DUF308 family)